MESKGYKKLEEKLLLAKRSFRGYPRRFASRLSARETANSFLVSIPKIKPKRSKSFHFHCKCIIFRFTFYQKKHM